MAGTKQLALPGDVAAYGTAVQGIGGETITFEEEAFDAGVRHSVIDHEIADHDGDGMLDFDEFSKLIRDREEGFHSDVQLKKRFAALDSDGSGKVDMSEYMAWALRDSLIRSSQRVLDLFTEWDTDGSGTITVSELYKAVRHMGFNATKEQVRRLFKEVDDAGDGDGNVDYRELNAMLRSGAGSQEEQTAAKGPRPFGGGAGAPTDRQGWSQNRRALKRKTVKHGRGPQPLSGLLKPLSVDGEGEDNPLKALRAALALNSSRVIDLFRSWDIDGNGEIDQKEFRKALFSLGVEESMGQHVDALFKQFDKDNSGAIDYREVNRLLRKEAELDEELKAGAAGEITLEAKNAVAKRQIDVKAGRRRMGMQSGLLSNVAFGGEEEEGQEQQEQAEQQAAAGGRGGNDDAMRSMAITAMLRRELKKNWARVREIFRSWDTNGDGLIQPSEFNAAMRSLGLQASDAALEKLFASFDRDGGGTLDYEEMNALLKPRKSQMTLLTPSKLQRTIIPGKRELFDDWMASFVEQPPSLAPSPSPPPVPPIALPQARSPTPTRLPPIMKARETPTTMATPVSRSSPPTTRHRAVRAPAIRFSPAQPSPPQPAPEQAQPSPPQEPPQQKGSPRPALFLTRAEKIETEKRADLEWFQQLVLHDMPDQRAQQQPQQLQRRGVLAPAPPGSPQRSRLWTEV